MFLYQIKSNHDTQRYLFNHYRPNDPDIEREQRQQMYINILMRIV